MKKLLFFGCLIILVFMVTACSSKKPVQNPVSTNQEAIQETPVVNQEVAVPVVDKMAMVDCGSGQDPLCFINRMNECLPVTLQMMGGDDTTKIVMTILGIENEKCHFQRKINDVLNMNCFFPKGTMNKDTLDQTFGNDRGLQKVVDDACQSGW